MQKSELRTFYKEKRTLLSKEEITFFSEKIFERFLERFPVSEGDKIHIFLGISALQEVETDAFIQFLFSRKCRVFVPKMHKNQLKSIELFPDSVLEVNSWGIREPESNTDSGEKVYTYIVTPLLYCDANGNRVGYGKGFYDGLFADLHPSVPKIGLNFFGPSETIEDIEQHDIPLDYLVIPEAVLSFRGLP